MNFVIDFPKMLGHVPGVTFSVVKNGSVMSEHPGAVVIEVHAAGDSGRNVMFAECPNHPWLYHVIVPGVWRHVLNGPDIDLLGNPASGDCGAGVTFKTCVLENDPSRLTRFLAALN
jgi:hypothetical protein